MTKTNLLCVTALTLACASAMAQTAEAAKDAPKSDWTITGNAGLFSDYRFRGISQTNKKPAFQGGFDVSHASGFYFGNWNSNIDSNFYSGSSLEMDFYGGYKLPISDFTLDVGAYYYYYPGSGKNFGIKVDNTEIYLGGSYGPFSLKYWWAVSDFFGVQDSKNSSYLDGNFAYDLGGGFGVAAHVGYQTLRGGAKLAEIGNPSLLRGSVVDYKVGGTYDLGGSGFIAGLAFVGTNRDFAGAVAGRNISNNTLVVSVSKTF